jgi:poly(3-hydroxybutyrate) depolymerase
MSRPCLFLTLCCACLVATSAQGQGTSKPANPAQAVLKPGKNSIELTQANGHVRKVLIELPSSIRSGELLPVVFGFHGDGGPAEGYSERLSPYVRSRRIISVSPQGETMSAGPDRTTTFWNFIPGRDWNRKQADDLALVQQILALLEAKRLSDPRRIYATGGSAGGHMCNMLFKNTDTFAAIAPTKCGMVRGVHEPGAGNTRTPIFWVMGDQDKSYNGSFGEFENIPFRERLQIWRKFNDCLGEPKVVKKSDMTIETYLARDGVEVTFCTLPGITHSIPRELAEKTDALIIEFFLRHKK